MSDATAAPQKLPSWALLAGATALAVGTRILIALAERGEDLSRSTELTTTGVSVVAFVAAVGTVVGRRWINRLSGVLLGVVLAGIAALLLAGSSNVVAGLIIGLLVSCLAQSFRGTKRNAIAFVAAVAAGLGILLAAPAEDPLIWALLAGALAFAGYGYRTAQCEVRGSKAWLLFVSRSVVIVLLVAIAAWWGSLAPVRKLIAKLRAPGYAIGFHPLSVGPRSFRKQFETSGLVPVQSVALSLPESDLGFVVVLARLPALEYLELVDAALDEAALATLARAPALTTLNFSHCQVAETAWDALAQTRTLRHIQLRETHVGIQGIAAIAKIPALTALSLEESGASVEMLTEFANHPALSTLHCSGPTVRAEFLRILDRLPQIATVSLVNGQDDSQVPRSPPALSPLREMGHLPELAAIRGAGNLRSLYLLMPLDEDLRRGIIRETPNLFQLDMTHRATLLPNARDGDHHPVLADLSYSGSLNDLRLLLQPSDALRWVDVSGCGLEATDLALIARLPKLETLVLDRATVPPAALGELAVAPLLSAVSMRKFSLPDGVDWSQALREAKLAQLPALRELDLANNGIVDAELASLGALPNLRSLNLKGNPLTNAALAHLAGMASLERLDLRETQVTAAGLQSLQQRLPALEIRWSQ